MTELTTVIVGGDEEQRAILQMQVHATAVAKTLQVFAGYPMASADLIMRRIQDLRPDVVLVDIPKDSPAAALHAIELLHIDLPHAAVFAVGQSDQHQMIISSMRSGAREFLERPTSTTTLLEAFVRLTSIRRKTGPSGQRGKLFTFVAAKGGSGATTLAVNTAVCLQRLVHSVALVDLAPLGHAAVHFGVRPAFTILDAVRNLQRLDDVLLEGYMTTCTGGVHLLAGCTEAFTDEIVNSDFPRLFDLLLGHYQYVIVDGSSRHDRAVRLVCDLSDSTVVVTQADVASLWSAAKLQASLGESVGADRLRLVVNRYRKIHGFADTDIEAATQVKLLFKIPNQYATVAAAIDRGVPVAQQEHSDIARAFQELAAVLSNHAAPKKKKASSFAFIAG